MSNKKLIDISWPISPEMTTYKDKKPVTLTHVCTMQEHGVADTSLTLNMHTGTHIDAPSHFINGGATVEQLSLEQMNGPCRVLDLTEVVDGITPDDLMPHRIQKGERVLLKTRNSYRGVNEPYDFNSVYVSSAAAEYLVERGVALVGIDALGIERNQPNHETHTTLFLGGAIILEGIRLSHVPCGEYQLWLMPIAVQGIEAALARAVLCF